MDSLCYLCGKPAPLPLALKDTFTSHPLCKVPTSDKMCDRCHSVIAGEQKQMWYYNKDKWSKVWGRSLSRVYYGNKLVAPVISGEKEGLPVVSNLLTRADIRNWLLHPPAPPFTIVIAESGQKHVLPWAQEAQNKAIFPVQFELDTLYVNHAQFVGLLEVYERLMETGFTKGEIDSGEYRSEKLVKVLDDSFFDLETKISAVRGTRLLQLISFVATTQQNTPPTKL